MLKKPSCILRNNENTSSVHYIPGESFRCISLASHIHPLSKAPSETLANPISRQFSCRSRCSSSLCPRKDKLQRPRLYDISYKGNLQMAHTRQSEGWVSRGSRSILELELINIIEISPPPQNRRSHSTMRLIISPHSPKSSQSTSTQLTRSPQYA